MAFPFLIAAAALAAAGAVKQWQAADYANKVAKYNAKQIEAETAEEAFRLDAAQGQKEGQARARAAASGVRLEGSNKLFLEQMSKTHDRELDWLRMAGQSRADAAKYEGQLAKTKGKAAALGTAASTMAWFA